MDENLVNTVSMAIGARGTGKTPFVLGDEKVGVDGLVDLYLQKDMKVLFVDTLDHNSYRHIKYIAPENINLNWQSGVYRTWVRPYEMEDLLNVISENCWNTFIVLEDTYKHQKRKLSDACARLIGDSKQQNNDLLFMYHTWKFVPLDLLPYLDYIEIFKTNRLPGKREEEELADHFEKVLEVNQRVNNHSFHYYHESVEVTQ